MAVEIKMPQLSDTMDSGKILAWRRKAGEAVKRGDILAEVETDKANLEIEAFHEGTLLEIMVPENQVAQVGQIIAYIGQPGEKVGAASQTNGTGASHQATPEKQPASVPPPHVQTENAPPVQSQVVHQQHSDGGRVKASPLARRIARDKNLDLSNIAGSGPEGRIVRKDVENATEAASEAPRAAKSAPQTRQVPSGPIGAGSLTPLSKMRSTIARRMQEAVVTAPHFYVTNSICMDEASKLREILKKKAEYKGLSINHFIIKACAYALQQEPTVNRSIKDDQLFTPAEINVGIVVAIPDGLLIPVIRSADTMPLRDIVFEARAAIERARAGRPNSQDLSGGTFSISNLGMYDVENFTAIINPGQGAILAVSALKEQAISRGGRITSALMMNVTLSVDHRIIDGVMAGKFVGHLKEALENPALLFA